MLSLTSKQKDMDAIYRQFSTIPIKQVIFTKADETATYGSMINFIQRNQLAPFYITNGQNVPDDIVRATPDKYSKHDFWSLITMNDQAEILRKKVEGYQNESTAKTLAVISGKGGVGKSNFSLNFAISLAQKGKKILLFDMDIGMGNIDILLGKHSPYRIIDFFEHGLSLAEIMTIGPEQVSIITGGTGLTNLFTLDETKFSRFMEEFNEFLKQYDYIIFDMGAGMTEDSVKFLLCVDELIVIATPEPTAVMDAYSIMKYLHSINNELPFFLVCNRVLSQKGRERNNYSHAKCLEKILT